MSAMKNLDFIVQNISMTAIEYEDNKELINAHMYGKIPFSELPEKIQSAIVEWESDELELGAENYHDIESWEDYT